MNDINRAITGMVEFGIVSHTFTKDLPEWVLAQSRAARVEIADGPKRLELVTVLSSIMFLAGMLAVAAGLFLLEVAKGRRKKRGKRLYL